MWNKFIRNEGKQACLSYFPYCTYLLQLLMFWLQECVLINKQNINAFIDISIMKFLLSLISYIILLNSFDSFL